MYICEYDAGTPIQRYVASSLPDIIGEVCLFPDGGVGVHYTLGEFDPETDFTPHVAHYFHSLGSALTFVRANVHRFVADDRVFDDLPD